MSDTLRDLRYAFRSMRHNKAVTAVCAVTLALGIGANSTMFSVVNAVLLKPLPVAEPDRIATVVMTNSKFNETGAQPMYAGYAAWREAAAGSFESIAAAATGTAAFEQQGATANVRFWRVSANFLPVLGVSPERGRNFSDAEDVYGSTKVAMISGELWRSAFAADPRVLGTVIKLDGESYTIVGVVPRGFHVDGRPAGVYAPMAVPPSQRDRLAVNVYARLKPGVNVEQATAQLESMLRNDSGDVARWRPRVWKLRDFQVRDVRTSLAYLMGAVGLVLLIACANTASALLARASARSREIALRAALGASRNRLVRQLLAESAAISALGAALGLVIAGVCARLLPLLQHDRLPGLLEQSRVDGRVLLFTLACAVATTLIFGAGPAFSTTGPNQYERLGSGRQGRAWSAKMRALVVGETALALMLAIGATLLVRTFFYLRDVAPGFRVDRLVVAKVNSDRGKFTTPDQCIAYYNEIAGAIARIPGVRAVTYTQSMPLTGEFDAYAPQIEGHHFATPRDFPILWVRSVDTGFFKTMEIPLRRGRFFDDHDVRTSGRVAIVNDAFARRFWPGENPIGKHIDEGRLRAEVIGVVGDVRSQDSTKNANSEVYLHWPQAPAARVTVGIRIDGGVYRNPLAIEQPLRAAIASVDKRQPVTQIAEMRQLISDRIAPKRLSAQLIAIFAGLALALAGLGIYGVLSFAVARRTQEIGIRVALGAESRSVLALIIREAGTLAGIGVAIGIAASVAASRSLKSLVAGVSPTEPWVYAGASVAIVSLSIAAALLPAFRATRVDPAVALRDE